MLLAVVAVALVVRIGYVAGAKHGPCHNPLIGSFPTECAVGDQLFYNGEANRLAQGDGFVEWAIPGSHSPPAADHPPLTVLVLAPVAWLSIHGPLSWIHDPTHLTQERYFMALLGTVLVALIGLLGRRIGGDRVGLLAALLAALYPNLWVNDGLVMSETVTGVTVVGALLLAYALRARPRTTTALLCGAVCGLAALARAELILFVPLLAVPAAIAARGLNRKEHLRLAAFAVAAAALVVGPWVLYNVSRFKEPTFISTNDGLALAGSNCAPVYSKARASASRSSSRRASTTRSRPAINRRCRTCTDDARCTTCARTRAAFPSWSRRASVGRGACSDRTTCSRTTSVKAASDGSRCSA